jgi:hypothetical protein
MAFAVYFSCLFGCHDYSILLVDRSIPEAETDVEWMQVQNSIETRSAELVGHVGIHSFQFAMEEHPEFPALQELEAIPR